MHNLRSFSFPEEDGCRTSDRDTCRGGGGGAVSHAIDSGPYWMLAAVLCTILKCGQEISASVDEDIGPTGF